MARNATTQETALQTALKQLSSVKTKPTILKGRAIIQIDESMDVKKVPIARFLTLIEDVKPIQVQRNDLYRLNHGLAKHIEQFELPQACFALVYFEGQFYLVDGNTRKRSWLNQPRMPVPSHVFVAVMAVDTFEQAVDIYNCYDSKSAKKTSRDDLLSMFHAAGLPPETLVSKQVAGGKLVSVIRNMARAMSGGSASPNRRQAVVTQHAKALRDLDKLGLDEGMISGAGVWALLRLYQELPRGFIGYVDRYAAELRKLGTAQEHLAATSVQETHQKALRNCLAYGVGTSGEKPIPVMFPAYLEGFLTYGRQLVRLGQADAKFSKYLARLKDSFIAQELTRAQRLKPALV